MYILYVLTLRNLIFVFMKIALSTCTLTFPLKRCDSLADSLTTFFCKRIVRWNKILSADHCLVGSFEQLKNLFIYSKYEVACRTNRIGIKRIPIPSVYLGTSSSYDYPVSIETQVEATGGTREMVDHEQFEILRDGVYVFENATDLCVLDGETGHEGASMHRIPVALFSREKCCRRH